MKPKKELIIKRPDDWHLHLRDGEIMRTVVPAKIGCDYSIFYTTGINQKK